jgi:aminopeptidase N
VLEAGSSFVASDASGSRLTRVTVRQRPALAAFGRAAWPLRTRLLVWPARAAPYTLPVELRGRAATVVLPSPAREPALLFPNAGDNAYAVALLDRTSVSAAEERLERVNDPFLRAMLWGALWDVLREARYAPASYVALAERELPREPDEQIASSVLARVARAANRYLSAGQRDALLPALEGMLLAAARDTARSYGMRKSHLDALVAVAATPPTLDTLARLLDGDSIPGLPVRAPTRWAIVTTLVARGAPGAEERIAAELARDSTTEGRRRAFVAGAARPTAASKSDYFRRYFADSALNEDWATASLGAFNAAGHDTLTLAYLCPALDSLRWIQQHRRIFYLGSWLDAFLGGQSSPEALATVRAFLARNPQLPADLRAKVLQSADDLERTVRIRERFAGGAATGRMKR